MAAVLTRNPIVENGEGATFEPPRKDTGEGYRFEMIYEAARSRAYADTAAELLDVLIPGYEALDESGRLQARVGYGTALLPRVQAVVLQGVDQTVIAADEKAILLAPRHTPVVVDEWASEVPLVLLDAHYEPYSEIPQPRSVLEDVADPRNLIWIRVVEEFDLLVSLNQVGLITLSESNDFVV